MSRTRRLRGVAALSAATLATAGLAGPAIAADECVDEGCADGQFSLNDLVKAFGGEEIPEDALAKIEFVYEQLGMENPPAAFLKMGDWDGEDPGAAFAELASLYELLGIEALSEFAPEDAFPKLKDAFIKVDGIDGDSLEGAFLKIDAAMPVIEEALIKLGASEEIDPAMLKLVLEMLPEDE